MDLRSHSLCQEEFQKRVSDLYTLVEDNPLITDESKAALSIFLQAAAASSDSPESIDTRFQIADEVSRDDICDLRRRAYAKAFGRTLIEKAAQI